jgi:hypothetical protein
MEALYLQPVGDGGRLLATDQRMRAASNKRQAAADEPRTLMKIGEEKATIPTNEQNVRRGLLC